MKGEQPITINDFPRAILHLDADAFFASCEQAVNPSLKGKPIVVGKDRGIVTAASYEAKALGVERGMMIKEVERKFPEVIVLSSDYEKYSIFSLRIFDILRRFSPIVEEYSIDEAFVDLTGLRRIHHSSYEEIGFHIKETIKKELGITVSVGISLTKVLAKIASKHRKPDGLTVISGREIHLYLKDLPISEVWGIGPNTASLCEKLGIKTALEFARKPENFIRKYFSKPFYEIWLELRGISVYPVNPEPKSSYKSISKALTFTPTSDKNLLFAHLSLNLEKACFKARKYELLARKVLFFLRRQDFSSVGMEIKLSSPSAYPLEILPLLRKPFEEIFEEGVLYRQTGVILADLLPRRGFQPNIFESPLKAERIARLYEAVDDLAQRFGRSALFPASSFPILKDNPLKRGKSFKIPILPIKLY
ncbi:MAG: DNA polymerase Y family protein [bacterium]